MIHPRKAVIFIAFGYDGSVRIKADLNHNAFDRGLASMSRQVDQFGVSLKKLAGLVSAAFGVAALVKFGKESIKLASDIEEVQNVIDVTFGGGAAQIEKFAQSAAAAFGLSELSAKQYTGTMGAMLKSSGLAASQAQEMSIALTGLAGDIASFYNLDTDTAFEKIRAGISGETEPLKQLGINMSVANMEAYALSQGITKIYNAMSPAEQTLLRYNYLLSVTTDAQGDFARTSGSFANQLRILQLNFDQLRIAVGSALIPIAQAVLPGINAIIAALTKLARVFAQVSAMLFGKKQTGMSGQASAQKELAATGGAAASSSDQLADALDKTGEAAKKAGKEMKGVVAPFDEFNIIASQTAGSAAGAAGGIDASIPDLDIPDYENDVSVFDELGATISSLGELFVKTLDEILAGVPAFQAALLEFAGSFNEFNRQLYDAFTFPGVRERVEQLGRELAEAFNALVLAIDWELWGRTLGAGLNLGLQFLTEFIYTFDWISLGTKLAELINGVVYEVDWTDFGRLLWAQFKIGLETFAGFFLGLDMPALAEAASNTVMGFFDSMQETIAGIDWEGIGRQIAEFLNNIDWVGVIDSIAGALEEMVPAALELIGGFLENADPDTLLAAAAFFGSKLLGGLLEKVVGPIAKEVGSNLLKKIAETISNSGISSLLSSISTAIAGIAQTLAGIGAVIAGVVLAATSFFAMWNEGFSWAKEAVMLLGIALTAVGAIILGAPALAASVIAGIVAVVATLAVVIHEHWEEIKAVFLGALEAIQEAWSAVGEWFHTTVIEPVQQFFTELWENIKQLASDALEGIQGIWNAVSEWFSTTVIQPVTEGFKAMWEGVKQLAGDIWEGIKGIWNAAGEWFKTNVADPVGSAFEIMGNFIKNIFNGVIGAVEGLINGAIKAVNWLISQLNKIKFDVPDWVPGIGGKNFGFNIQQVSEVKLPRLAQGAVIPPNRQFAAILGDQRSGMNLEAPAALIRQMVTEGIQAAGGGGGGQPIQVNVMLDRRVIATAMVDEINSRTRSAGRSPLLG